MHARCTHDGLSANPLRTLKKPAGRNGRSNRARLDGRPFSYVFVRSRPFSSVLARSHYDRRFGGRSEEVAEFLEATPQYVRRHPERLAQSYGIPHFAHLKHGLHGNCRKEERGGETVRLLVLTGVEPEKAQRRFVPRPLRLLEAKAPDRSARPQARAQSVAVRREGRQPPEWSWPRPTEEPKIEPRRHH